MDLTTPADTKPAAAANARKKCSGTKVSGFVFFLVSALLCNSCVEDLGDLFRHSQKMRTLEPIVTRLARTDTPVLLGGEPGVGKKLVARAIHALSARANGPFEILSCTSLPGELLEEEIFGTRGKLEQASDGTLLLAEVAELPDALRPRLAHAVHEKQILRADHGAVVPVDTRLIVSSSHPLTDAEEWRLLGTVEVVVPPLRERREEIRHLVERFLTTFAREFSRPEPALSSQLLEMFTAYRWPGNVRELEDLVKRWVVLGDEDRLRQELHLRATDGRASAANAASGFGLSLREIGRRAARAAEQAAIHEALERVGGNRAAAARLLRVSYKTLLQKMSERDTGAAP